MLCRVYAVYRGNKKLLILLVIILAVEMPTSLVVLGGHILVGSGMDLGLSSGCGVGVVSPKFGFGVLPPLIYETIMCLLMILKSIQNYRDGCGSPLLSKMIYDSVVYFVGIFAALFVNFIFYSLNKQAWAQLAVAWETTIPCTMGCRLLVNTMEWAEMWKSYDPTTSIPLNRIDVLSARQSGAEIPTVTHG